MLFWLNLVNDFMMSLHSTNIASNKKTFLHTIASTKNAPSGDELIK